MIKLVEIIEAFYGCRKHKRRSDSTLEFELDYECNCVKLCNDINNRTYKPLSSIAFIVLNPRMREVFAANFRDRIVNQYIDTKIRPLLEKILVATTCNNRKGKGISACVNYLKNDIIEVSENYTKDCFIAKMDISGFFMSIIKSLLLKKILQFVDENYNGEDKEDILWLLEILISNNPEENCVLKSPWSQWLKLDKNKSLFFIGKDFGLPIGDLLSQLMANFYLNDLDHFITDVLGFTHYGRYVDDFYIVSDSKEKILNAVPLIREKLKEVGLELHKKKFYIQHCSKGIEFVGTVIKPGRTYVHNRTVNNAFQKVKNLNKSKIDGNEETFISVVNSYLGFMKNHSTYSIRRNLIESISPEWRSRIIISDNYEKIILKDEFKRINITKSKLLKNGNKKSYQSKVRRDSRKKRVSEQNRLSDHKVI